MAVTIKEWAKSQAMSEQAARRKVSTYQRKDEEFASHVTVVGKTRMLDEWAVNFLNERRQGNDIIYIEQTKNARIEKLKQENEQLRRRNTELLEEVNALKDEKIEWLQGSAPNQIEVRQSEKKGFLRRLFNRSKEKR